jgi:hypothetical protein
MLPTAVTWSNGNVFRALTLLATKRCAELGLETNADGMYICIYVKHFKIGGKWQRRTFP